MFAISFLVKFLHQLAFDMKLQTYTFHYALDFPLLVKNCSISCVLTEQHGSQMTHKELLQVQAPSVFNQLECIIRKKDNMPFNYIEGINDLSRNMLQVKRYYQCLYLYKILIHKSFFFKGCLAYFTWDGKTKTLDKTFGVFRFSTIVF